MDSSAVPIDCLVGLTEQQIVAIKANCVAALTAGKVTTSYSVPGGQGATKQIIADIPSLLKACRYALQLIDPDTYGRRISKTYASFSGITGANECLPR